MTKNAHNLKIASLSVLYYSSISSISILSLNISLWLSPILAISLNDFFITILLLCAESYLDYLLPKESFLILLNWKKLFSCFIIFIEGFFGIFICNSSCELWFMFCNTYYRILSIYDWSITFFFLSISFNSNEVIDISFLLRSDDDIEFDDSKS